MLKLRTAITRHFTAYMWFTRLFGLDWTIIFICNSFKFSDLSGSLIFNSIKNQQMNLKNIDSGDPNSVTLIVFITKVPQVTNKIMTNYKGS